jgi:hypothetical protein
MPLTVTTALLLACAAVTPEERAWRSSVSERPGEGGLILAAVDLDGDGRPEVFNHYQPRADAPRLLVTKEVDLNGDGRIDQTSRYEDGVIVRREFDTDFDGRVDRVDHYLAGERTLSEQAVDGERFNLFRYYESGQVARKERDTDGDGEIDTWEYFESGAVARVGLDEDGDGDIDKRLE